MEVNTYNKYKLFSKILLLLVCAIFFHKNSNSQYYSSGQDPASVKWMQINTENFQIIFPMDFEKESQKLANKLEIVYNYASVTLKYKPRKISVILHTQSVKSNASVTWAPKRMDFYTCPPQDSYPQDWLEQLAVHEFRHVVQIGKINQGLSRILYFILGEQATGAILGIYVPLWFLEGDAVVTETALSKSGRGRVPSFEMKLRTQLLQNGKSSYDKAVFGSFKDYLPNHYILGYHLVAVARKNFGTKLWSDALNKVARYPYIITPFNKGIKNNTGLSKTGLYNHVLNELDNSWRKQQESTPLNNFQIFTKKENKFYTNYNNTHYINDSTVIAEKSGIDDISRFVLISRNGKENRVFTPGIHFDETLSYSNGKICWSEKQYDKRWDNRNFAVIKIFDLNNGKLTKLSSGSRYFAPAFSHKGDKIITVNVSTDNVYSLVILNANDGEVIKKFTSQSNDFFITPCWGENDDKIITILLNEGGKSLAIFKPETSELKQLLPYSFNEISKPIVQDKYIFFTGAYSGIDNIYALDTTDLKVYQVTSAEFGARDPDFSHDGKKMIYSDYTSGGYHLVEINYNPELWKPLKHVENNSIKLYKSISAQEKGVPNFSDTIYKIYEEKKYRKIPNLINIHSWAPLSIDIDNTTLNPGFSIMSQNKLSSTFTTLGYEHDLNEKTGKYYFNLDYEGLYPIFNIKFETGKRASNFTDDHNIMQRFTWDETSLETGIRLPLNLTQGKYFRQIQPQLSSTYINMSHDPSTPENFIEASFQTMDYRLTAYNLLKTSIKNIYPKWGQTIDLNFRSTPFTGTDLGNIVAVETRLYFPGLTKHHSLNIYAGIQKRNTSDSYYFSDLINYPKGYSGQSNDSLYSLSFNYDFPLLYPDFRIGSLIYLKRIRANIFYDYGRGWHTGNSTSYNSTGAAIFTNFHFLRLIFPVDLGFRVIYVPEADKWTTDFLISVNFGSL